MNCYSLTLGSRNRSKTGGHFLRRDEQLIHRITQKHFPDGFTILEAEGGWFDPKRKRFIREQSRQVLVCTSQRQKLAVWCRDLAAALQQQEFLIIKLGDAQLLRFPKQARHASSAN